MSHAPGPWEATATDGHHHACVSPADDRPDHFTVVCIGPNDDAENANARLIAAAPDLLEACKGLLRLIDPDGECPAGPEESDIAFARATIAKARGE